MKVDGRGDGVQAGFGTQVFEHRAADRTRGRIGGRRVVVATAARLMELHRGYEPRPEDLLGKGAKRKRLGGKGI